MILNLTYYASFKKLRVYELKLEDTVRRIPPSTFLTLCKNDLKSLLILHSTYLEYINFYF